jgi:hypothetical protein
MILVPLLEQPTTLFICSINFPPLGLYLLGPVFQERTDRRRDLAILALQAVRIALAVD